MLEDALDPRPSVDHFTRFLGACAAQSSDRRLVEDWLRCWNDRAHPWTNLRNFEHWIERGRIG